MADRFDKLFFPQSLCVVGASRDPAAYGHVILKNLISGGFAGKIFPVNPKTDEILGIKCYSSVMVLPEKIDLAIVVVPAPIVPSVMKECAAIGIKFAIVISAGFREIGDAGRALEAEMLQISKPNGIGLVGPNCMGVYNSYNNMTATFTALVPKQGSISFISQSGAVGLTMLAWAKKEGIGFSKFVSVGNEADLSMIDFLNYFNQDKSTKVITIYMESVKDGRLLVESLKSISKKKPVIVMKVGTTLAGAKAAQSHTGALAVEDSLLTGIFKQFSIIRARDSEELFELATSFASLPLPAGRSAAVVTSGGGWAVECSDLLYGKNIDLTPLTEDTINFINGVLPPFWSKKNPVDMVASANSEAYYLAVKKLMQSEKYDMVFLIGYGILGSIALPSLNADEAKFAKMISLLVKETGKPLYVVDVLGTGQSESARAFQRAGIPVFETVRSAVEVASAMANYHQYLTKA